MANVGPPSPTPGERDPRTLGNDEVASPTGTPAPVTATEGVTGAAAAAAERQEGFAEIGSEMLGLLGDLSDRFEKVNEESGEEGFQSYREATRGNWFVQFKRALDPRWDRNLRAKHDLNTTAQMVSLAGKMSEVAAQFRLSNPVLDQAMKRAMKRSQDQSEKLQKITSASFFANAAMESAIKSGMAPSDPVQRQRVLADWQSTFMSLKSPEELIGEQLKVENAIQNLFVTKDDIDRWGPQFAPIVENRLKEQKLEAASGAGGGRSNPATFMDPKKLMTGYLQFVGIEEDLLRLPLPGVPQMEKHELSGKSGIIEQEAALELTQGISEASKMLALDRFAKWVEIMVGAKFVPRAIESLGVVQPLEDLNALIEANGPLTNELYRSTRDQTRSDAVEAMRRNLDKQLEMRFSLEGQSQRQNTP